MPLDWGLLAATTATFCAKKLADFGAATAWREKVEPAFRKSGLDHELTGAFAAGFRAFIDVLRGPFHVDEAMDERLREMFADGGFQETLAELPRARFEDVDTARARELFRGLGPAEATASDFDVAWRALGRHFADQVAGTTHAAKLVEHRQRDRMEDYLKRLVELAEGAKPRRDEDACLTAYRRYVYDLYRLADTRGLFWREKEATGEDIQLAEIFVETLVRRKELRRKELPDEKDRTEDDGTEDDERRPLYREVREEARAIADVLAKERRLVILGPPGSGKSTLMRCLALALAADDEEGRPLATGLAESTVPILVTLKTYAARLKQDATLKLDAFLGDQVGGQLPGMEDVLRSERALVLLDGLDEVFDESHRRWVSEEAWRLMSLYGKARFVLTGVLERWMGEALADHPEWTAKSARAVSDLLQVIQERTGLLVDAGGERYVFVHLSLQEYLVAFYLLDRLDDAACCRVVRHFLHAPEWEEILRLTIGAAPRVRADALVQAILADASSEYEEETRRDLRFACRCLQDRPSVGEAVRRDVRTRWLAVLESRSYHDEEGLIADGTGLGLTSETRAVVEACLADNYWTVRLSAVWYFAQIGADDERTRAAIEARLEDDDFRVRSSAVEYFTKIGAGDEKTRAAFEARLKNDDGHVRSSAIEYFAQVGADDEKTRAVVEACLKDDDGGVRSMAAKYFAQIGANDEKTCSAFEEHLADSDWRARHSAISYFLQSGVNDERTRAAVRIHLGDENVTMRTLAVSYFVQLDVSDEKTRAAIEALLADQDKGVRTFAIWYFEEIGADDEKTRKAIRELLTDDDFLVRSTAADYFAQIRAYDRETRASIEALLADNLTSVCGSAVAYFARIGAIDEEGRKFFEGRLEDAIPGVRAVAIILNVEAGLDDRNVNSVLDAAAGVAAFSISEELRGKLSEVVGRLAAADDTLLRRITEEYILGLVTPSALAATAASRDEIRRESTPLADVLAGRTVS